MDKKNVSAVVLAGGNSTRMGQNKALLKLGSQTVIEIVVEVLQSIFSEVLVVTNTPHIYSMLNNVRFVQDCIEAKEKKSIIGLYTGILEAKNDNVFAVACDMPFLNTALIRHMVDQIHGEDTMVPYIRGYYQPLHAIYNKSSLKFIKAMLDDNNYKIIDLFEVFPDLKIKKIEEDVLNRLNIDHKCFLNMNTYQEYINIKNSWFENR